jgi:uncharacterized protein (DUF305 family)
MNARRTLVISAIAALSFAACGGSETADTAASAAPTATAPADSHSDMSAPAAAGASFNEADVAFVQGMIPHHEGAIEMADIALDPAIGAGAAIKDLATRIKAAQDPEINQMKGLLTTWGQPAAMDMTADEMAAMDGMMSVESMEALEKLTGAAFDKAWAAMMIDHHAGAITASEAVKAAGSNPDVLKLADAIIAAQQAEIAEMTPLAG